MPQVSSILTVMCFLVLNSPYNRVADMMAIKALKKVPLEVNDQSVNKIPMAGKIEA